MIHDYDRDPLPFEYSHLIVGWDELAFELTRHPKLIPGSQKWSKTTSALQNRMRRSNDIPNPHFGTAVKPVWIVHCMDWVYDVKANVIRPAERTDGMTLVLDPVRDTKDEWCLSSDDRSIVACSSALVLLNLAGACIASGNVAGLKVVVVPKEEKPKTIRISKKTREAALAKRLEGAA